MKKVRLNLEDLIVESFVTSAFGEARGVFAMGATFCGDTCNGISPTCEGTMTQCFLTDNCDLTGGTDTCTAQYESEVLCTTGGNGPTEGTAPSCTLTPC